MQENYHNLGYMFIVFLYFYLYLTILYSGFIKRESFNTVLLIKVTLLHFIIIILRRLYSAMMLF